MSDEKNQQKAENDLEKETEEKNLEQAAGNEKLLAGKFKSSEDLESAYKELERGFHTKSEEAAEWKRNVADLIGTRDPVETVSGQDQEEAVSRFNEEFLANPSAALDSFAAKLSNKVTADVGKFIQTRDAVSTFTEDNPDVRANPMLFAMYLSRTDPKASIGDRLTAANKSYTAELNEMETKIDERRKKAADFETKNKKDAMDVGPGAGKDTPAKKKKKSDDDDDDTGESYEEYMKTRKGDRAKITGLL